MDPDAFAPLFTPMSMSPAIATELAERIPSAELTMLDGAGHFVMEERRSPAAGLLWL